MMTPSTPIFFGGARHLAGWYSQGAPGTSERNASILLCPPIGHEYMCSHRAYRWLASDLSARGFSVLRFDYYASGDSAGEAGSESLLPNWLESISLAGDELRRLSGCDSLAFVGLRFGATLAATAASSRSDVESLVLWNPCVSGRSLVRQTRLLAMAAAARPGDLTPESDGMESIGFLLNATTVADVARIKMDDIVYPMRNVLIMTRDDGPSEQALSAAISRGSVGCEEQFFSNYATFMVAPTDSILPIGAIESIATWLDEKHPSVENPSSGAHKAAVIASSSGLLPGGVRESAVTFSGGRLAAILAEPASASGNPGIVLLNSGADHHVGPHRMYAPLAREWAELGFPVLRLDLTGIGDSYSSHDLPTDDPYPPEAVSDIHDAISFMLENTGCRSVILAGMCSGAYHAIYGANKAVSGIIAVNPPLFHHAGDPIVPDPYYNNHAESTRVARALLNPEKWRRLFNGSVDISYTIKIFARRIYEATRDTAAGVRQLADRDEAEQRDPVRLFHEGVAMHIIFNAGDKSQVFFDRKLAPRLKKLMLRDDITVDVVDGADHTFMPVRWQRVLAELMTQHVIRHRATQTDATSAPRELSART